MASRGNSFGLDLLGIKMSGIRSMASDPSGAIRLALLPDIFRSIKKSPWLGSGLGTTVTYTDPLTSQVMTRSQFDWGYLEMIAELGIIGTIVYLIFLMSILSNLFFRLAESNDKQSLYLGLIAGAIALFVVNITTPALFQGFGVIYFVVMIAMINDVSSRSLPEHSRILEPL
jgi:O-antigen ligase